MNYKCYDPTGRKFINPLQASPLPTSIDTTQPLSKMSGPNKVSDTNDVLTWKNDGCVKIQIGNDYPANMEPKSLVTVVKEQCEEGGDKMVAFQVKRDGEWIKWSYTDYYTDIQCVARAFVKLGLEERKTVCIQGFNSPEWFLSCQGAIHAGGVVSMQSTQHILGIIDNHILCTINYIHPVV